MRECFSRQSDFFDKMTDRAKRERRGKNQRRLIHSMNLRFRNSGAGLQEIEVAAFVGLADMGGEHRPVAAPVTRLGWMPGGAAAGQILFADVQMDAAVGDVDLDLVTRLH